MLTRNCNYNRIKACSITYVKEHAIIKKKDVHTDVLSNVLLAHYAQKCLMECTHHVNSMYTLMYLQATCVPECFITYYINMNDPRHVNIHVVADDAVP
jgi:hypothetical protein